MIIGIICSVKLIIYFNPFFVVNLDSWVVLSNGFVISWYPILFIYYVNSSSSIIVVFFQVGCIFPLISCLYSVCIDIISSPCDVVLAILALSAIHYQLNCLLLQLLWIALYEADLNASAPDCLAWSTMFLTIFTT